jgi:hypothetical protein
MIICGLTILISVPTFYVIVKNGPTLNFLKYRVHSCLFCKMYGLKLKWWGPQIDEIDHS